MKEMDGFLIVFSGVGVLLFSLLFDFSIERMPHMTCDANVYF